MLLNLSYINATHSGVFKIIEAVVGQDEPSSLPSLYTTTCETQLHVSRGHNGDGRAGRKGERGRAAGEAMSRWGAARCWQDEGWEQERWPSCLTQKPTMMVRTGTQCTHHVGRHPGEDCWSERCTHTHNIDPKVSPAYPYWLLMEVNCQRKLPAGLE